MEPVGAAKHRTNQANKDNEKDNAAPASTAAAASKTKLPLQPVENLVDQKEL